MAGKKNYSLTEAWRTSVHLFFSCLSCRLLLLFARKEFREWKKRRLAEVVILFCSAPALCQWDQIGPEASSPTFHLKSQLERHADLVSSVFHGNIWIFFQGFFFTVVFHENIFYLQRFISHGVGFHFSRNTCSPMVRISGFSPVTNCSLHHSQSVITLHGDLPVF